MVSDANVTISRHKALKAQIIQLLSSIQHKADSDTPLTEKEKGFITSATIPISVTWLTRKC